MSASEEPARKDTAMYEDMKTYKKRINKIEKILLPSRAIVQVRGGLENKYEIGRSSV